MACTDKLFLTEDKVRDTVNTVLGLKDGSDVQAGVGQITTFNQLGISGVSDKPDGWYLPHDKNQPALILECKASSVDIGTKKCVEELKKNCRIVLDAGYRQVFGLLTNGRRC